MKKLTIEFVRKQFEKEGYELINKEYVSNDTKLSYICPNGHEHIISWNKWSQGRRCPFCKLGKVGANIKLTLDYIKKEFEKEGYTILSKKYVGAHSILKCKCPNNHVCYISWHNWNHNRGCSICKGVACSIRMSGNGNPVWQGGISFEPYCQIWADKEYKESIKERDGHQCLNPYCLKISKKLTVHHINYNKKFCGPENLITLCNSCNVRANKDRKWHTQWYQTIMNKRYGYAY